MNQEHHATYLHLQQLQSVLYDYSPLLICLIIIGTVMVMMVPSFVSICKSPFTNSSLSLIPSMPLPGSPALFCGIPIPSSFTDRKSTRLNSSHVSISYAVFCLKKKKTK